jgi:hypothetical protein
MRALPTCLILCSSLLGQPAWAHHHHDDDRRQERREEPRFFQQRPPPQYQYQQRGGPPQYGYGPQYMRPNEFSPGDAARRAQQMNGGGRILSVDPNGPGYRVKVLKEGEVRVFAVPGG